MLLLIVVFSPTGFAQTKPIKCGYETVLSQYEKAFPGFKDAQSEYYQKVSDANVGKLNKATAGVYTVNVVFHIVYNTPEENLDDTIIYNQLDILNKAYRHTHADVGNTRPIFQPFAADAEIEFQLATKDPNGNPTTGITRTYTDIKAFGDLIAFFSGNLDSLERVKYSSQGGIDAWPTDRYLNIWVADISDPTFGPALLGYATPPMNPLPPNWNGYPLGPLVDGVVLLHQIVGDNNPNIGVLAPYASKAKTAVHEVGHYLGLRHIGGDAQDCASSNDGIDDTPTMLQSTQLVNACQDTAANSCSVGAIDTVDMWENYMDYSNDMCQTMFTNGQVALMRSVISNQRFTTLGTKDVIKNKPTFTIYPNPAANTIYVDYPKKINSYSIYNILGQVVQSADAMTMTKKQIELKPLPSSNYILELNTSEGKLYQRFQIK